MESNFTFDLRPRSSDESKREFLVDMYLYLPNALGVNSSSFDNSSFFRHRTNYYRVRAPLYHSLRSIEPQDFTLESADKYFAGHLCSLERERLGDKVVQDTKLFGNFLHTEFKKTLRLLSGKKRPIKEKNKAAISRQLQQRTNLLWQFRERYVAPVRKELYLLDEEAERAVSVE